MLSGRSDGSSNGTGSANLAIGEIAQPGLFKIFATNPSNAKYVLEEFLVPKDSPVKTMAELKGKRVASGPGIQNVTLAKTMLERAGAGVMSVTELPIGQHVAAIAAGQIELEDGTWVHGFVCESEALRGARDITQHGGWRAYLRSLATSLAAA